MKASKTLLFILSVFLLLGVSWFLFPAEGIAVGKTTLRFPSYAEDKLGPEKVIDVDSVLDNVSKSFEMNMSETLSTASSSTATTSPSTPIASTCLTTITPISTACFTFWNTHGKTKRSTGCYTMATLRSRWTESLQCFASVCRRCSAALAPI